MGTLFLWHLWGKLSEILRYPSYRASEIISGNFQRNIIYVTRGQYVALMGANCLNTAIVDYLYQKYKQFALFCSPTWLCTEFTIGFIRVHSENYHTLRSETEDHFVFGIETLEGCQPYSEFFLCTFVARTSANEF